MARIAGLLIALGWISCFAARADAADTVTANTLRLAQGEAPPSASIDDIDWLAGAWAGEALGGHVEEIWSAPRNGVMMGMFRLIKDDRPSFYELLTLSEIDGTLELRLKPFDAGLKGWEEREDSVVFPLVAAGGARLSFEGLTFERNDDDQATIYLAIRNSKDGSVREEIFRYRRAR